LAGYDFVGTETVEDGVRLYGESQIDLVVADIKLPGKDGLQVIKELNEKYQEVKVIVITGYEPDALDVAKGLGALKTFTKPPHIKKFVEAIQEIVGE
tara:strand:+ start:292 stop:582 length:291 start_codon:yes stop_codon:yes gene_type:complete